MVHEHNRAASSSGVRVIIKAAGTRVRKVGAGKNVRYFTARVLEGIKASLPVYCIDSEGAARLGCSVWMVEPEGLWLAGDGDSGFETGFGGEDLLVAEHLALEILAESGRAASKSQLLQYGEQTFLEVERFDRTAGFGRRGVVSLGTLADTFAERGDGAWPDIVASLHDVGRVDAQALRSRS